MTRLFFQRLGSGLVTLFLAALLIFICTEILPGDVASAILGREATAESLAALRRELGLDKPALWRFFSWLMRFVSGDLGNSLANGRPVWEALSPRLINTLFLAAYTSFIALPLSLILALLSSWHPRGLCDRLSSIFSFAALSLPEFLVGYLLVLFLAVQWQLFPSLANVNPQTGIGERLYLCFLPMLTLTIAIFSHIFRITRSALLGEMHQPYVTMAELKGLGRLYILIHHALPNAIAPIGYAVALNLAHLVLGVVVVETIFVYPGLGQWMVDGVAKRDLPVVQASGVIFAAIFILLNLLADLLAIIVNPRLRYPK